jgi:hypothetical protein
MAPCFYSPGELSLQAIEIDFNLTYGGGTTVPMGTIHIRPALGSVRSLSLCLGPMCWACHWACDTWLYILLGLLLSDAGQNSSVY